MTKQDSEHHDRRCPTRGRMKRKDSAARVRAFGDRRVDRRAKSYTVQWRATADEDGHYCFAVALWCCGLPRAPIGNAATACDFPLRFAGGCFPDIAQGGPVTLRRRPSRSIRGSTWCTIEC